MILICPLPLWSVGGENLCMPYTLESDVQIRPSQKMPNNWEREALTRKLQIWMTSICQKPWTWTQKIPCQFWEQFYIRNEKQFPKNTVHMAFQVLYCSASSTGDKVTMNRMAGNGCKWGIQPILHVLDDDLQDVCVIIWLFPFNPCPEGKVWLEVWFGGMIRGYDSGVWFGVWFAAPKAFISALAGNWALSLSFTGPAHYQLK